MLRLLLPTAQCGYSCMIYGQNKGFEELFCGHQVELLARKCCMLQSSPHLQRQLLLWDRTTQKSGAYKWPPTSLSNVQGSEEEIMPTILQALTR